MSFGKCADGRKSAIVSLATHLVSYYAILTKELAIAERIGKMRKKECCVEDFGEKMDKVVG